MLDIFIDVLRNSFLITGLVMIMMLMIEYFNIHSHGKWFTKLKNSNFNQVLVGSFLGLIPGCIGGFAAVSLFTHKMISFGALTAMMIASSGDEAFVMLAIMPKTALLLFVILFIIAIATGMICDKFLFKKMQISFCPEKYEIHEHHDNDIPSPFKIESYKNAFKKPSKERIILLVGISLFIFAVITGLLGHDHESHNHSNNSNTENLAQIKEHNHSCDHTHAIIENHTKFTDSEEIISKSKLDTFTLNLLDEKWMNITFAIISIITILFTATAKEHFIKEHLWNHVVKRHCLSIFLWTFGGLLICQIGIQYLDIEHWIGDNMLLIILLAVAIGIIPESGPHLVFVTLFFNGLIPFSVLLANSIVQDGHTALPLLASSQKSFIKAKIINLLVGLIIGISCWIFGI
jgi:Protein of unknown function (DUF2899).